MDKQTSVYRRRIGRWIDKCLRVDRQALTDGQTSAYGCMDQMAPVLSYSDCSCFFFLTEWIGGWMAGWMGAYRWTDR